MPLWGRYTISVQTHRNKSNFKTNIDNWYTALYILSIKKDDKKLQKILQDTK